MTGRSNNGKQDIFLCLRQTITSIQEQEKGGAVEVNWTPGHVGTDRNETADHLAKETASNQLEGNCSTKLSLIKLPNMRSGRTDGTFPYTEGPIAFSCLQYRRRGTWITQIGKASTISHSYRQDIQVSTTTDTILASAIQTNVPVEN